MTTSVYPDQAGSFTNTEAAAFIPELWADEVIAEYEKHLVMAPLVRKMSMVGKKGDTVRIPKPGRGTANAKVARNAVTIQNNTATELLINIDQHWEHSMEIEDITDVQARNSMRQFYTSDAGYALAVQLDSYLFDIGKEFGDGDGTDWTHSNSYIPNAGGTGLAPYADAGSNPFTDAALRALIKEMDDANVPMDGRKWVIPPAARQVINGITKYTSSDFVNSGTIRGGKIGELYGVDLHVTTNATAPEADTKSSLLFHTDSIVLVEQMGVRTQTQYKQEWLADLFTADRLYGSKAYRPESGFVLVLED